jgi:ankyrin repeat protein
MNLADFLAYLEDEPGWDGRGPVTVSSRSISGDTALHVAIWAQDDQAARALLEAGADVNAPGEDGYTPLHVAVAQNNVAIARDLVARGASWDTINEFGSSSRRNALASNSQELKALAQKP